jgi:hypothetical protein
MEVEEGGNMESLLDRYKSIFAEPKELPHPPPPPHEATTTELYYNMEQARYVSNHISILSIKRLRLKNRWKTCLREE